MLGAPIVGLKDSGGARIQEGVVALDGYGRIFRRNVQASGVIPQISVIMGPCAGGAVYSPAITDFVYQVDETSHLFITGPDVIKAVTGEEVSFEELGGAHSHAGKSGVAHFVAPDGRSALEEVRYLLSFLPPNNVDAPPYFTPTDDPGRMDEGLTTIIPDSPNRPYDAVELISNVVDDGEFYQIHEEFAGNIVVGFARLDGHSVGVIANQPTVLAGTLNIDASIKAARFVRMCDSFNVPIVTFVDVPGFLPGVDQEHGGIIRHGAKLLYAYCEATVPRVTVITRKSVRRCVRRHELTRRWGRRGLCLAISRDRGDGGPGCRQHHPPPHAQGSPGEARRADRRLRAALQQPLRGRGTGSCGRRDRAPRDEATPYPLARHAAAEAWRNSAP